MKTRKEMIDLFDKIFDVENNLFSWKLAAILVELLLDIRDELSAIRLRLSSIDDRDRLESSRRSRGLH